jgi:beta-carotene 3-hydroxylase
MIAAVVSLIGSFLLMEGVAWATHKYVMHGFLWYLHRDHHQPKAGKVFQKNDWFFLIFSLPGIALIVLGSDEGRFSPLLWGGIGVSLYGAAYFFVHEVFIHRRLEFLNKSKNRYLSALRSAHMRHHKCRERVGAECFGMLLVPFRFFRRSFERKSSF